MHLVKSTWVCQEPEQYRYEQEPSEITLLPALLRICYILVGTVLGSVI
jgi:hypothetical protein